MDDEGYIQTINTTMKSDHKLFQYHHKRRLEILNILEGRVDILNLLRDKITKGADHG